MVKINFTMSVKTKDVNSNIVKKEARGVLDDHAFKVEKFVKTELNLKPYLQVNINLLPCPQIHIRLSLAEFRDE